MRTFPQDIDYMSISTKRLKLICRVHIVRRLFFTVGIPGYGKEKVANLFDFGFVIEVHPYIVLIGYKGTFCPDCVSNEICIDETNIFVMF